MEKYEKLIKDGWLDLLGKFIIHYNSNALLERNGLLFTIEVKDLFENNKNNNNNNSNNNEQSSTLKSSFTPIWIVLGISL